MNVTSRRCRILAAAIAVGLLVSAPAFAQNGEIQLPTYQVDEGAISASCNPGSSPGTLRVVFNPEEPVSVGQTFSRVLFGKTYTMEGIAVGGGDTAAVFQTETGDSAFWRSFSQAMANPPKNCVAYDKYGRPFRVACPMPANVDYESACKAGNVATSPNAGSTPAGNGDARSSAGEAIALGALAIGAGILANELADQFFTEPDAPTAPGGNGQTRINIVSVKAIETTFGFGGDEIFLLGSNGARIPSDGAQDIDAGQTWSPNATVTTAGGVSFDLREWDSFNASDRIGNFAIAPNTAPGRYTATLRGDGAVYEVTYDITGGQVASGVGQASGGGSAPPVSAPAPQGRRWSASGLNGDIVVADCTDCGDDIGVLIACQGVGQPAIVSVPWLATENGPAGLTLPLEMSIGSQRFVYDATLGNAGMVGHVPQFRMNPHDPALDALMAGSTATLIFDGVQANIDLRGSRSALSIFEAHCGWNTVPAGTTFGTGQSMPTGNGPDFSWFAGTYQDQQAGGAVGTLSYGIPETDAISFSATCRPGQSPLADVSFNVGLRTLQAGEPATLYIQPEGVNYQYAGSAFSSANGEFEGVEARIALSDPVWQAMMTAQNTFLFGAYGGGEGAAQPVSISSAVSQFLETCGAGAGQVSNQGQTGQQSVFENQTQQQVQLPPPQQDGAIDGTYACSDGSSLQVAASTLGTTEILNMVRNGTDAYALTRQPAQPVGVSYAGSGLTLTAGTDVIQLAGNGASLFCQKQ